jgi:L-lysine exporter family protein LysE/ArgO
LTGISAFTSGFLVGGSLIIAIGAQNAFVLRQGLIRQHVLAVALFCALADAMLIVLGIAGLGAAISAQPALMRWIALAGAAFLFVYGAMAAKRAWQGGNQLKSAEGEGASRKAVLAACAAFTLLNPHVYLDTVLLVGSIGSTFGDLRWIFAAGAATASFLWFFGLAYGARLLAPVFAHEISWRILDAVIALVMFGIGASLLKSFL